jgi:sugar-phosphatase
MRLPALTEIRARALIFDMDGTLVDSTSFIARLWRQWAARHGLDPDIVLRASPGRRTIETIRRFAPAGVDVEAEAALLASAAAEEAEGLRPVAGAPALLGALPRAKWAVVTSAERRLAEKWLRQAGLPVPDVLVSAEDVTVGKPDPEGFLRAAGQLGHAPADIVVFEDAPSGLAAGYAAGARVIALASTLGAAELDSHDWIADFRDVSFASGADGTLRLRIGDADSGSRGEIHS